VTSERAIPEAKEVVAAPVSSITSRPAPPPPPPPPPSAPAPTKPPPAEAVAVDHVEALFEAMHDLTLLESAPAGARFCLEAALRVVPCMAALVHLRDPATSEMTIVHAQGPRADRLLRTTMQPDALVTRAALAGKPMVVTYGEEPGAERTLCARHALFDPWSVVLVPVMHGGQLLALMELVDPVDGNPSDERTQGALVYVASKLGRFLAGADVELEEPAS
jgi:hypothetical protein